MGPTSAVSTTSRSETGPWAQTVPERLRTLSTSNIIGRGIFMTSGYGAAKSDLIGAEAIMQGHSVSPFINRKRKDVQNPFDTGKQTHWASTSSEDLTVSNPPESTGDFKSSLLAPLTNSLRTTPSISVFQTPLIPIPLRPTRTSIMSSLPVFSRHPRVPSEKRRKKEKNSASK